MPFFMSNKLSELGAVASYSGVAKKLDEAGFRFLHASVMQPCFPLIAGKRLNLGQVRSIQATLTALPGPDEGKLVLKAVGIQGYVGRAAETAVDLHRYDEDQVASPEAAPAAAAGGCYGPRENGFVRA